MSLIDSQASAGFLVPLLFCEQTYEQEHNNYFHIVYTNKSNCTNVAGVTQIVFHNNTKSKRWKVQHVLNIGQRKNGSS